MKSTYISLVLLFLFSLTLSGCFSTGAINAANITEVQLAKANYEIVAVNVRGEASAGYLLGASASAGRQMQTFALFRVSGSGLLYEKAVESLWENFKEEHGEIAGRHLALINIVYDAEALNLLLYTRPTVSVRADVIEFTEE